MKKIVLVYDRQLPEGSASATRAVAFAHIFKELNYRPILIGVNYARSNKLDGMHEGIEYQVLDIPELQYAGIKKMKRVRALQKAIEGWIKDNCSAGDTAGIVISGTDIKTMFLGKTVAVNGIPIIADVVEWYDATRFSGFAAPLNYARDRLELFIWNKKIHNVLTISTLLEDFYKQRGCNTIRIPTILDLQKFLPHQENENERIIIVYAGSPARKDCIINVVRAISMLSEEEKEKVELRLYGITAEQLVALGLARNEKTMLSNSVHCYGRVSHARVKEALSVADFTVLLRPQKRYANAGFPTKVGESMASGVPVIANITSDIGLYLRDGIEGLICDEETPESCVKVIRNAIRLSATEKTDMRKAAYQQAKESFQYTKYTDLMSAFLNKTSNPKN